MHTQAGLPAGRRDNVLWCPAKPVASLANVQLVSLFSPSPINDDAHSALEASRKFEIAGRFTRVLMGS